MTNTDRMILARQAAGLTQGALAKSIGASQPFVSQVEHGERALPPSLLAAWADACDVRPEFFMRSASPLGDAVSGMVHRRLKSLPARPFHRANATIKMAMLALDDVLSEVTIEPANPIPSVPPGTSPTDAAALVRRLWRVPQGPLPDLVALLESAGIPVLHSLALHEKHSGISHRGVWFEWAVILNARHPASRLRFSLAHELGHIVLGHDAAIVADDVDAQSIEDEADAFAAALLLPAEDARRELRDLDYRRLVLLKSRWRVSIAFLIRQAFTHGLVDQSRRRSLEIQLSSRPGGRRREDAEFDREEPALVRQVLESLFQEGLSWHDIELNTALPEGSIRSWLLGEPAALAAVPHGAGGPTLRLVHPAQDRRARA